MRRRTGMSTIMNKTHRSFFLCGSLLIACFQTSLGRAEDDMAPAPSSQAMASPAAPTNDNQSLLDQIAELRAQVSILQAKSPQKAPGQGGMNPGARPPMGMGDKKGMSAMGPGMMGEMGKMMGGMGAMGAAGAPATASSMPAAGMAKSGSPEAPAEIKPVTVDSLSLYQIGEKEFFIDQAEKITFTTKQHDLLVRIKEHALSNQAITRERIGQAERDLWFLTSAEDPDAVKIKTLVRQIEKLRGDERIDFIDHIGKATGVLTIEQRHVLLGKMPSQKK
jgi:hypothetical protein